MNDRLWNFISELVYRASAHGLEHAHNLLLARQQHQDIEPVREAAQREIDDMIQQAEVDLDRLLLGRGLPDSNTTQH